MFGLRRLLSWFSRRPEIQPPCQPVFWTLQAVYLARAYYVVAELKIADLLAKGPMTCELVGGSFFDEVPAGGDAYVIKHVLRDWDDQSVIKILNNCHRAMPSDAVLLVIDATMDPRNLEDRIAKLLDVEQMLWLSGKLRTTQEWDEILDQTGFRRIHEQRTAIADAVILECQKAT